MMNNRLWALLCSVFHYGMGNLSASSKPARTDTVITTAKKFEGYLDGTE